MLRYGAQGFCCEKPQSIGYVDISCPKFSSALRAAYFNALRVCFPMFKKAAKFLGIEMS